MTQKRLGRKGRETSGISINTGEIENVKQDIPFDGIPVGQQRIKRILSQKRNAWMVSACVYIISHQHIFKDVRVALWRKSDLKRKCIIYFTSTYKYTAPPPKKRKEIVTT